MAYDPNKRADVFMTVEGPNDKSPRAAKESSVTKRSHVATTEVASDAERIVAAKARNLALVKENDLPGAEYGFQYPPEYFKDGCGVETSVYDFEHLFFILGFLQDPKFEYLSHNHGDGSYNSLTGVWTRGDVQISIDGLKKAVAARIAELGISETLLLEHLAVPHSAVEYQKFCNLSFESRMQKFRAA